MAADTEMAGRLVNALCSSLVYSLLQGVLIAVGAGLVVACTKKLSAALRYNLLVSALFAFASRLISTAWPIPATRCCRSPTVLVKPYKTSANLTRTAHKARKNGRGINGEGMWFEDKG